MQEKEKIQHQLQQLQKECITEYLQNKLEAIATKQVINDILQGFMTINKEEFIQNITESILEVKRENKYLRQQLQSVKKHNYQQLQYLEAQLIQSDKSNEVKYNQMSIDYQETIATLKLKQRTKDEEISSILQENQNLKSNNKQILKKVAFQQDLIQIQKKERQKREQLQQVTCQLKKQIKKLKENHQIQLISLNINKEKEIATLLETKNQQNILIKNKIQNLKQSHIQDQDQIKNQYQQQVNKLKEEIQYYMSELFRLKAQKQKQEQNGHILVKQNEQLQLQIGQNYEKLSNSKIEKEALQLGLKYYKQEDSYLREQLLKFDERYQKLKSINQNTEQQFNKSKQQLNQEITKLNLSKLNQIQYYKQQLVNIKQTLQKQRKQFLNQRQIKMNQYQIIFQKLENQKEKNIKLSQQLQLCKQQLKCLHQQVNMYHTQIQMNLSEIQFHKNELLRVNQQCRSQLQTCKQAYECNWTSLNQEMIQEKYKIAQLQNQNKQLTQELSIQKQKERFYSLYLQQISQLKSQIQLLKFPIHNEHQKFTFQPGNVKSKFYYYIFKIKEEIKLLKRQNKELRQHVLNESIQYNRQISRIMPFIIEKIKQECKRCMYCQHQKSFKSQSRQNSIEEIKFQKTVPKVSNQNGNFLNIKKTLKNIQQRYQIINQQNKFYSQHIEGIMKRN